MTNSTNPRTARARNALMKAARRLAAEKPVADITLTEVANEAGVSRPTVYKLFNDVPSLVAAAAVESIGNALSRADKKAAAAKDDHEYFLLLMRAFVRSVYRQRRFSHNVMYGPSAPQTAAEVIPLLSSRMEARRIGKRLADDASRASDLREAISAGVVWMLTVWLGSDFKGQNSPDAMAERLASALDRLSADAEPHAEHDSE